MATSPEVFLARAEPESLPADVLRAVDFLIARGLDAARPVLVKFNGNFNLPYPGSNTSRWFLDALLGALRQRGFGDVSAIEGDLPEFRAADMVRTTGLGRVFERHSVPFRPLEGEPRDAHEIPTMLHGAQLLNVPVMHTHAQAVISCATKNLFGVLPWDRRKYHGALEDKLFQLRDALPCFTIVDGTVGLDGESTRRGNPVRCDLVIAGRDGLAIDWIAAQVMGFRPLDVPLLREAYERGLVGVPLPVISGDFDAGTLPRHRFELELSWVRRVTNALNKTPLVRFDPLWRAADLLRVRWHRVNRRRKQRVLESGPWTVYERTFEARTGMARPN